MKQIRNRLFIQILIPTMVIFFLVIGGGLLYVNRSFEQQMTEQKSSELTKASRAIHNWLVARISNLIQLSRTPLMHNNSRNEVSSFLREERKRLAFIYDAMYYINLDGSYWSTSGESGRLDGDLPLFDNLIEGNRLFYYHGPVLDSEVFSDSILIAVPIENGGSRTAVLAATIPIPTFQRMVGYFTMEEFDSFMMVNPRSIIIVHSNTDMIGTSERGEYGTTFSSDTQRQDDMVFVSVLRTTWKLVGFIDRSKMLAPIVQINQLAMVFFFLVLLIIGSVSLAISYHVARPIRRLTSRVNSIMEGNYRQKIQLHTQDELEELADAFNRLSDRLIRLRTDDRFVFLGHVSARVAHEVRKPLHIIQLVVQTLKKDCSEIEKHLHMIESEVENADRFVGEILNFARPEQINSTRYDLHLLLEKIIRKYQIMAGETDIRLKLVEEEKVHPLYMDIIKMEEAISNLLINSIEALKEVKEGQRRITVTLYTQGNEIIIAVEDTGPGFPEDDIDKLLDPYFTTKDEGTGLGLSISYRILTAHGGKLILENTPEHHARILITLPL
ncbi:MAG: sensor histidine kinase [Spirochaetaceae bacterium]|nr:sensor histidine kinase [Spirochaetaceae bacterium]MCF7948169.1 sensor histidine kinase [Spirochaetia bacterium]MCF7951027.1 sensor histidine kinase [Spirochaetaceae bacterium]